jgi:hypothetical protein
MPVTATSNISFVIEKKVCLINVCFVLMELNVGHLYYAAITLCHIL